MALSILDDALANAIHQRLTGEASSDSTPLTSLLERSSSVSNIVNNSPILRGIDGMTNMMIRGYGDNNSKKSSTKKDQTALQANAPVQVTPQEAIPDYSNIYQGALELNDPAGYNPYFGQATFGTEPEDTANYAPFSASQTTPTIQIPFGGASQPVQQVPADPNAPRTDDLIMVKSPDNPWGNPNPNWEQDQINALALARDKKAAIKWKNSHGIAEDGTPYKILSDGRKIGYPANSATGKAIIQKYKSLPSDDMLSMSALEDAQVNHNYASAQQYDTALKSAGQANANQQVDPNNPQQITSGTSTNAYGTTSTSSTKAEPQSFQERLYASNAQEVRALQSTYENIKNKGYAETSDFDNMANSIVSIRNNMFQQLEQNTAVFGGVKDIAYALGSNVTSTSDVAQQIITDMGYPAEYKASLAKTITDLKKEYANVPIAAIGMILKQNLTQDPKWFTAETNIVGNLEYQDSNLKMALSSLNDKTHSSSYERLKDQYMDCANFMNKIKKSATQLQLAEQAQATYIKDSNSWGSSKNELHQKWLQEDKDNITKYTANTLEELLGTAFSVGGYYHMNDRVPENKNDPARKSNDSEK